MEMMRAVPGLPERKFCSAHTPKSAAGGGKGKLCMDTIRIRLLVIVLPIALACFPSCKFFPLTGAAVPPLEQLEIGKREVSNWNPEGAMEVYVGVQLFDLIDGGAPPYLDKGLIKTGYQRINGPTEAMVQSYIFDFGSEIKAVAMYKEIKTQIAGNSINNPAYPDSVAIVRPVLGGVSGYAHFRSFYFELNVTGFSDQMLAIKTLNLFLGLYAKKVNAR